MSISKAVFSFFDPAEINKPSGGKSATPRASDSSPKPPASPTASSPVSTGSRSSYMSASSSTASRTSPPTSSQMGRGQSIDEVGSGEISITCNISQDESCNSQITERANNKSPVMTTRNAYNVNRTSSNVSGGAMSHLSGSNASSTSVHSAESGRDDGKSASSVGIQGAVSGAGSGGATQTTIEANYEEGASELFLLVESASWEEAIIRYV